MFIRVTESGITYPYTTSRLRADEPNTSFPDNIPDEVLAEHSVYPVQQTRRPDSTTTTRVVEAEPLLVDNIWMQQWSVIDIPVEELRQMRSEAYKAEADPLFFKWQRGEATQQDWLDKVAEIAARYPY